MKMKTMKDFKKCIGCDGIGDISEMIKSRYETYSCESCFIYSQTQQFIRGVPQ